MRKGPHPPAAELQGFDELLQGGMTDRTRVPVRIALVPLKSAKTGSKDPLERRARPSHCGLKFRLRPGVD